MARGKRAGAEIARHLQHVAELDLLVAGHARDRRFAGEIAVGELAHHVRREAALIVEHVVRDPERLRHPARVANILAGATGSLLGRGLAVIVELQRDADDVVALRLKQRRYHRGIHPARHGHNHAGISRGAWKVQTVEPVRLGGGGRHFR